MAEAGVTVPGAVVGRRRVLLAAPRSFCAGVERAIDVVELALGRYGRPVYVRRQIVHNTHVVHDLESKGAVFVEELDDVPNGAVVVLAAHGVAPGVREEAARRSLLTIDATCPLVAKVHREARRYADAGYAIVLVGHADHEEIVGTAGEAPDDIAVVATLDDVIDLRVPEDRPVAYLTQTTLATDETGQVVEALRARFPGLEGPAADDICYATQNRQDAVRLLAGECDLILVVGSRNSSNSNRLVEVSRRAGCAAHLIEDETEIDPLWIDGAATIGLTAGASAPEAIVQRVVRALAPDEVVERHLVGETVHFTLPPEVR
jgi:4-hydroxy-3-methylbut-2-en-1-yl diphosphate reductase